MLKVFYMTHSTHFYKQLHWHHTQQQQDIANGLCVMWWVSDTSWLSYFSFQPVLHNWCKEGSGMFYPVWGMVHIKDPLLLIKKNSLCSDGSRFPHSCYVVLYHMSDTI